MAILFVWGEANPVPKLKGKCDVRSRTETDNVEIGSLFVIHIKTYFDSSVPAVWSPCISSIYPELQAFSHIASEDLLILGGDDPATFISSLALIACVCDAFSIILHLAPTRLKMIYTSLS